MIRFPSVRTLPKPWAGSLTVMSTLGFGDITLISDIGRAFSTVVLLTDIVLLLIVLSLAFIRLYSI